MSQPPPPTSDPFAPMRRSYEEALEAWSKTVEQMVGTDRFASASNQLLAQYVEMQKAMRDSTRAAADAMHVPTKDDLARVADLVVNVERKVDEVARQGHGVADVVERLPVEGMAALPRELRSLEGRIDALSAVMPAPAADHRDELRAVAERLSRLEGALEALRASAPGAPPDPAEAVAPVLARLDAMESSLEALRASAPGAPPDPAEAVAPVLDRLDAVESSLQAVRAAAPPPPADPAEAVAPVLARLDALEAKLDAAASAAPAAGPAEATSSPKARSAKRSAATPEGGEVLPEPAPESAPAPRPKRTRTPKS